MLDLKVVNNPSSRPGFREIIQPLQELSTTSCGMWHEVHGGGICDFEIRRSRLLCCHDGGSAILIRALSYLTNHGVISPAHSEILRDMLANMRADLDNFDGQVAGVGQAYKVCGDGSVAGMLEDAFNVVGIPIPNEKPDVAGLHALVREAHGNVARSLAPIRQLFLELLEQLQEDGEQIEQLAKRARITIGEFILKHGPGCHIGRDKCEAALAS